MLSIFINPDPGFVPDEITEAMMLVEKPMRPRIALHQLINSVDDISQENTISHGQKLQDVMARHMRAWRVNYARFVTPLDPADNPAAERYMPYAREIAQIVTPTNSDGTVKNDLEINSALYRFTSENRDDIVKSLTKWTTDVGKAYKDENTL